MDSITLIWLTPIIFMLHDLEEIIMFKPWYDKNRAFILSKFPKAPARIVKHFDGLSTSSYAFVVAGEFIVLSLTSYVSAVYGFHYLWFGAMAAFGLHLVIHIGQFVMIRKYIPVILTTVPALAYCTYAAYNFMQEALFNYSAAALWTLIIIAALIVNFILWQYLAVKFEKFLERYKTA